MTQEARTSANTRILLCHTDSPGFSAIFAVATPIPDASGIAHVVEHLVFRSSTRYPEAHNLFAAVALLPVKINATTLAGITYYFIETEHERLFYQALEFVYAGLIHCTYRSDDIKREKDGVIFQELTFRERQPGYEAHITDLMAEGRHTEAVAGGFSGGLAQLNESAINTYKATCYSPQNITLLMNNGDIHNVTTLLDIAAAQESIRPYTNYKTGDGNFGDNNCASESAGQKQRPTNTNDSNTTSKVQPRPEQSKMLSRGIAALIECFINEEIQTDSADSSHYENTVISVPFEYLNSSRVALFPPIMTNNQASFVREAKSSGQFPFNTLPSLPKYVLNNWERFHPFLQVKNAHNDWYYAFPMADKILPRLEALLMREKFWSPRISGDCYAQGIGLHEQNVVVYAINDAAAANRKAFCEQLRAQLFDV